MKQTTLKAVIELLAHVSATLGSGSKMSPGHLETLALRLDGAIDDLQALSEPRQVTVMPKFEFGQWRMYPACPVAQKFADFIGQKTLTAFQLGLLKDLGYKVVPKIDESEFNAVLKQGETK